MLQQIGCRRWPVVSTANNNNIFFVARRWHSSVSPPLSLLSWAVDGSQRAQSHAQRRLSVAERSECIVATIASTGADIVALQDSTPHIAASLCEGGTTTTATAPGTDNNIVGGVASARYALIGAARNGRFGELQLLRRVDSPWAATLLHDGPGVSAELTYTPSSNNNSNSSNNTNDTDATSASNATAAPLRMRITNIDNSYRGKSLGRCGHLIASAEVSADGSPYTLERHNTDAEMNSNIQQQQQQQQSRRRRGAGQLDAHRAEALGFVARVTRPDVLLGNLFMGRSESIPGYRDAWEHAGAPASAARTTDTFLNRVERGSNYFYHLPSLVSSSSLTSKRGGDAEMKKTLTEDVPTPPQVAEQLPLGSYVDATTRQWVCADLPTTTMKTFTEVVDATVDAETRLNVLRRRSDAWMHQHGVVAGGASSSSSSSSSSPSADGLQMHEVAGRYQRCCFRSSREGSATHSPHYPFYKRFAHCRVMVLRPSMAIQLGEAEMMWHTQRVSGRHRKRLAAQTTNKSEEVVMEEKKTDAVADADGCEDERTCADEMSLLSHETKCGPSDQFPLLVLLS